MDWDTLIDVLHSRWCTNHSVFGGVPEIIYGCIISGGLETRSTLIRLTFCDACMHCEFN